MTTGCTKEFDMKLFDPCPECNGTGVEKGSKVEVCEHCHGQGSVTKRICQGIMVQMFTTACPHCHGQGYSIKYCNHCHGSRRVEKKKHISLKVPQGVADRTRLRLKDMGECGVCGGANGHLYAVVNVEESQLFERNGINIIIKMPVSPILAAIGGSIEVPSPYGYCKVAVPAGTKSGDRTAVYGKGLKTGVGTGNLVVQFELDALQDLDAKQKEMLSGLQAALTDKNLKQTTKTIELAKAFYA